MLEHVRISSSQIWYLIIGYTLGSSLTIPPGGGSVGNQSWLVVIIGLIEGIMVAWIYSSLIARFRTKTFVEISQTVFGSVWGLAVNLVWLAYCLHLASLVQANYTEFITDVVLTQTPPLFVGILMAGVSAFAVYKGIEVIGRCAQFLVPIVSVSVLLSTLLLIPQMDLKHLLPLFDQPAVRILWGAHSAATFPFAECVVFAMILPFMDKSQRSLSIVIKALVAAASILVVAAVRNTTVLGPLLGDQVYPSYTVVRAMSIADILTRLEILVVGNYVVTGFLKFSVLLYCFVAGIAQTFELQVYKPLVLPTTALTIVLGKISFSSVSQNIAFARDIYPIYAPLFQLGIPLVTLAAAWWRKLPSTSDQMDTPGSSDS